MKISDLNGICNEKTSLYREGEFHTVCLVGKEQKIEGAAITFLSDVSYIESFLKENIACVICTHEIAEKIGNIYTGGIAVSKNPKTSFFEAHNYMAKKNENFMQSVIADSAQIHPTAVIESNGVVIGENTIIGAYAVIKSGSIIGDDCVIREGVTIGTPGFYYYGTDSGKKLVTNTGGVKIGSNVEIHPHTVVEKGVLYGDTIIGDNTKLDNLILIGHDSVIGKNCIIAGSTIFAGGVEFGDDAFAGVGVSVSPYVKIGKGAKLSSGAVVTKNVKDNEHVSGNFAYEHQVFIKNLKKAIQK